MKFLQESFIWIKQPVTGRSVDQGEVVIETHGVRPLTASDIYILYLIYLSHVHSFIIFRVMTQKKKKKGKRKKKKEKRKLITRSWPKRLCLRRENYWSLWREASAKFRVPLLSSSALSTLLPGRPMMMINPTPMPQLKTFCLAAAWRGSRRCGRGAFASPRLSSPTHTPTPFQVICPVTDCLFFPTTLVGQFWYPSDFPSWNSAKFNDQNELRRSLQICYN